MIRDLANISRVENVEVLYHVLNSKRNKSGKAIIT